MLFKELLMKIDEEDFGKAYLRFVGDKRAKEVPKAVDMYKYLKTLEPKDSKDEVLVITEHYDFDIFEEENRYEITQSLDVVIIKGEEPYGWGLSFVDWDEIIGLEVYSKSIDNFSLGDIASVTIHEMSWFGYDVETFNKNIEATIKELDEIRSNDECEYVDLVQYESSDVQISDTYNKLFDEAFDRVKKLNYQKNKEYEIIP